MVTGAKVGAAPGLPGGEGGTKKTGMVESVKLSELAVTDATVPVI